MELNKIYLQKIQKILYKFMGILVCYKTDERLVNMIHISLTKLNEVEKYENWLFYSY